MILSVYPHYHSYFLPVISNSSSNNINYSVINHNIK